MRNTSIRGGKECKLGFYLLDASDKRCSSVAVIVIICSYIIEKDTAFCSGDFNNCNVTFNVIANKLNLMYELSNV